MYRSVSFETEELMALYGGEEESFSIPEEGCTSEESELDSEFGEEEARGGRRERRSPSLETYGAQREERACDVYFSNREYYWRLEELKRAHLRNMAELENMYISRSGGDGVRRDSGDDGFQESGKARGAGNGGSLAEELVGPAPNRRLQRINSQEELDFHETSSGSDQSELCAHDGVAELETEMDESPGIAGAFGREMLMNPETALIRKQLRFLSKASCLKPVGRPLHHPAGVGARSSTQVTVPKPFQMMLREEERKRQRVRTRSEVELENSLLRRELEELRECRKKFRASPAPAHIRLPLYEAISRRASGGRGGYTRGTDRSRDDAGRRVPSAASPPPFSFLERERRKKEARIVAELGNLGPKEERVFRARPLPSAVYGHKQKGERR